MEVNKQKKSKKNKPNKKEIKHLKCNSNEATEHEEDQFQIKTRKLKKSKLSAFEEKNVKIRKPKLSEPQSSCTEDDGPADEIQEPSIQPEGQTKIRKLKRTNLSETIPEKKVKIQKRKKSKLSEPQSSGAESDEPADEIQEPSIQLLRESEKPENIYSVKSSRTKKKEKHLKLVEEKKTVSHDKDIAKNTEYLNKWKFDKVNWKFEKLRQVSIKFSAFNQEKINEELWPVALEYLSASQGVSKTSLLELAEKEIDKLDEQIEETGNKELLNSINYRRAREILQSFD